MLISSIVSSHRSYHIHTLFFSQSIELCQTSHSSSSLDFFFYIITRSTPLGLIWSEVKQLWDVGLQEYVHDMWNVIDFITNSLYVATVALRVVSYFQVSID